MCILKKIKFIIIIISLIELTIVLHAAFSLQDVSTLLTGSIKILSAREFSMSMEEQKLEVFINRILNEKTPEVIEYEKGYNLLIEIKEGHATEEEFIEYINTKDEEYKSIVSILKVSQWIALSLLVIDILLGIYYFILKRRLKLENIS